MYANAEHGDEWVTVRVRQYGIKFPEEGIFVSLEFLPDQTRLEEDSFVSSSGNYLSLGGNFEDKNNGRTWSFVFNRQKWKQDLPLQKDEWVGNAMIKIELFEEVKK